MKVRDRAGIELASPRSAVGLANDCVWGPVVPSAIYIRYVFKQWRLNGAFTLTRV